MARSPSKTAKDASKADNEYRTWTVAKLKEELKSRSLTVSGKKEELIQRLESSDVTSPSQPKTTTTASATTSTSTKTTAVVAPAAGKKTTTKKSTNKSSSKADQVDEYLAKVTIVNSPLLISKYFILFLWDCISRIPSFLKAHRTIALSLLVLVTSAVATYMTEGAHQKTVKIVETYTLWYGWWVALGIASSVGLGTGLHTFVLFLGPFIARVATAAYECGSLDFATRGPHEFRCPDGPTTAITILMIAQKVRWEAFFWGFGTAIGELPPYFVARAAALAGKKDSNLSEIEEISGKPAAQRTFMEKAQLFMFQLMQNFGFIGIMLCASIPNPLFDLAGIVCGTFGVPFIKFFGATFIGKAIFKTSIQSFFIIMLFSKEAVSQILALLNRYLPKLHTMAQDVMNEQMRKFRRMPGAKEVVEEGSPSVLSVFWNILLFLMILYFFISMVESLALSQLRNALVNGKASVPAASIGSKKATKKD